MNTNHIIELAQEQKWRYYIQPDLIDSYSSSLEGEKETLQYIKGLSLRFWFNIQPCEFPQHWHTALEIIMPIEESYSVTIQQTQYHLNPGDIFIIPAGSVHSLQAPESGCRFIYILELDFFSQLPGFNYILSLLSQPIHIASDMSSDFYTSEARLIMQLAEFYWGNSVTKEINIYSCLLSFFAKLGENTVNTSTKLLSSSAKSGSLVNRLSTVLDYLDTHYAENITLEETASIACFSKFYFTRLFKQYTNQTFYDYLSARRIKAAEQMLIVPNLAITEISLRSGFASLSSFNRNFKRLKGCSPSEYRSLYTSSNTRRATTSDSILQVNQTKERSV